MNDYWVTENGVGEATVSAFIEIYGGRMESILTKVRYNSSDILLKTNKCLAIQGVRETATFILNFCHPIKISAKTPKQFQLMPSGNSNCNCL